MKKANISTSKQGVSGQWINLTRTVTCEDKGNDYYSICQNPECRRKFERESENQKYCGAKCRNKVNTKKNYRYKK